MVQLVCGREQKKKIQKISLPSDTVRRCTSQMPQDILDQVAKKIGARRARICLQQDESTNLSNIYMLIYCCYAYAGELKEEFLMCEILRPKQSG